MRRVAHAVRWRLRRLAWVGPLPAAVARAQRLALRWSSRPVGLAMLYHRVAEVGEHGRPKLVPALATEAYKMQVAHLRRHYRVVGAAELQRAAAARRRGRRIPVALTFDDDLLCHVALAAPILADAGVPGTFFLTGAALDAPFTFWWERLQDAFDAGLPVEALAAEHGLPADRGTDALDYLYRLGQAVEHLAPEARDAFAAALLELLGGREPENAGLRRGQVRRLAELGMTVGFHTRRHDSLSLLDDVRLAAALRDGRDELRAVTGQLVDTIGYPHGAADARVAEAARAAGLRAGFTVEAEPATPDADPLLIGRLETFTGDRGRFALEVERTLRRAA